jgi:hypothetical protein
MPAQLTDHASTAPLRNRGGFFNARRNFHFLYLLTPLKQKQIKLLTPEFEVCHYCDSGTHRAFDQ